MAPRRHEAGLFDIRNIIGGLLLVYGVILLVMGLFADQAHDRAVLDRALRGSAR